MTLTWLLSLILFAFAMIGSPGPNNMMLAGSGANFGLRQTIPHIVGITVGIIMVQAMMAAVGGVLLGSPALRSTLKWVGVTYILYLAFRTAISRPRGADRGRVAPMGLVSAVLFQWVNPKVWVGAGSAAVTLAASAGRTDPLVATGVLAMIFGLIALPCSVAWTLLGAAAGRLLSSEWALRGFNVGMAMLLVASLAPVLSL